MPSDQPPRRPDAPLGEFPQDFSDADTLPAFDVLPPFPQVQPRADRLQGTRVLLEARIRELQSRPPVVRGPARWWWVVLLVAVVVTAAAVVVSR